MPRSLRSPALQRCLFTFAAGLLLSLAPSPARAEEPPPLDYTLVRHQLLIGAGTALLAVPAGLLVGTLTAELSPNIIVAALPTVLFFLAFPPLAVAVAEWWISRDAGAVFGLSPGVWFAVGAHVLATVGAVLLGVTTRGFVGAAAFTLVEAVLLPATVTLGLQGFRRSKAPAAAPGAAQPVDFTGAVAAPPAPSLLALVPVVSGSF